MTNYTITPINTGLVNSNKATYLTITASTSFMT